MVVEPAEAVRLEQLPASHLVRGVLYAHAGLFDDADGLVQVSGVGLSAGQHVVVPST